MGKIKVNLYDKKGEFNCDMLRNTKNISLAVNVEKSAIQPYYSEQFLLQSDNSLTELNFEIHAKCCKFSVLHIDNDGLGTITDNVTMNMDSMEIKNILKNKNNVRIYGQDWSLSIDRKRYVRQIKYRNTLKKLRIDITILDKRRKNIATVSAYDKVSYCIKEQSQVLSASGYIEKDKRIKLLSENQYTAIINRTIALNFPIETTQIKFTKLSKNFNFIASLEDKYPKPKVTVQLNNSIYKIDNITLQRTYIDDVDSWSLVTKDASAYIKFTAINQEIREENRFTYYVVQAKASGHIVVNNKLQYIDKANTEIVMERIN